MKDLTDEVKNHRKPEFEIDSIFLNRWSARSMTGEELSSEELMPLFEAARWAPSSMNSQFWRFVFAKKNSSFFEKFFSLLKGGNKEWAKNASVLVIILSRKTHGYKQMPANTHSFDTGAAWVSLALEGTRRNLVVHPMAGFDYEKAKEVLNLSDLYKVELMVAIGKKGIKEDLPKEMWERETPSDRKKLSEIVFEGEFDSSK